MSYKAWQDKFTREGQIQEECKPWRDGYRGYIDSLGEGAPKCACGRPMYSSVSRHKGMCQKCEAKNE